MAKYGEGDKRWIVQDRPDGTNVHNWHWSETDCLEWSRTQLTQSLSNLTILNGENNLFIRTTKLDKLDGEAYVNIRKGKIIPGYELSLRLSWKGEVRDGDGNLVFESDGVAEIPYLSDENSGEDPDVKITVNDVGQFGNTLRDAFLEKGKPLILEKIREYVASMSQGGPCKDELASKKVVAPKGKDEAKKDGGKKDEIKKVVKDEVVKERKGFRTVRLEERFRCRAVDLYEILMDENRWKGFTQSNAKISRSVGGEFSIFDGSVTGTNVELQEGKCIVQKWRFGSWPDGVVSTVKLTFEEPEPGVTVVKLVQTDIPEEDSYGNSTVVENTERGWRDLIFHRIRAVFAFGL